MKVKKNPDPQCTGTACPGCPDCVEPRVLGYEIYTGETNAGQPLFKVTELVEMSDRHQTNVLYATEDYDAAKLQLEYYERELKKEQ